MTMTSERQGGGIRLLIGLVIAIFSVISYLGAQQFNPVLGQNQHLSLTHSLPGRTRYEI